MLLLLHQGLWLDSLANSLEKHYRNDLFKYHIYFYTLFSAFSFIRRFSNNKLMFEMLHLTPSLRCGKWPDFVEGTSIIFYGERVCRVCQCNFNHRFLDVGV